MPATIVRIQSSCKHSGLFDIIGQQQSYGVIGDRYTTGRFNTRDETERCRERIENLAFNTAYFVQSFYSGRFPSVIKSKPILAKILFSSIRGAMSPMVPNATISRYSRS
jgi:hypothetical protein